MSRYLYKKIQNISPESLNFQHSGLKLTTLGVNPGTISPVAFKLFVLIIKGIKEVKLKNVLIVVKDIEKSESKYRRGRHKFIFGFTPSLYNIIEK